MACCHYLMNIHFVVSYFLFWLLFFISYLFIFLLYNIVLGLHTLAWISHGCTWVPHSESPSFLPPHTTPLGHPSAAAPSILYHALNLDWRFISHMIIYMFQCHSPILSSPRLLPQSPKDCSIHLCLFCFLTHKVIITIFLNYIYMINILYWCFAFWLTSLCIIGSSFIHLIRTDSNVFFLMAE